MKKAVKAYQWGAAVQTSKMMMNCTMLPIITAYTGRIRTETRAWQHHSHVEIHSEGVLIIGESTDRHIIRNQGSQTYKMSTLYLIYEFQHLQPKESEKSIQLG